MVPSDSAFHVSQYWVTLVGKIMCYAIVAIAMDPIWATPASCQVTACSSRRRHAMGMYLMRQIGREGQYQADLPDFMVFLDWKELPGSGGTRPVLWRALLVLLVPDCWRWCWLLRLLPAREGRVLLDHHAGAHFRRDAAVLPQCHRLRRQQRLHRLQAHPWLPITAGNTVLFTFTAFILIATPSGTLDRRPSSAAC
jgi:hypothetical protein